MTTDEMMISIYSRKLDDLTFRIATVDNIMKKGFKQTDDQIETLIAVMEAKG